MSVTGKTSARLPPISVVVPTRDRPRRMLRAAQAILDNDYPEFELLIVDQSADEAALNELAGLSGSSRVRRIRPEALGVAAARNLGMKAAQYNLVAMTDDDCLPPKDWLQNLARAFAAAPQCGVVFGNVEPAPFDREQGFVPAYVRDDTFLARTLADKPDTEGLSACMGLRRDVWRAMGGFDERFGSGAPMGAGAEIDYTIRLLQAEVPIYETPSVSLIHDGFRDWPDARALVSRYWWGAGAVYGKHFRRHPLQIAGVLRGMSRSVGSRSRVGASLGSHSFFSRRFVCFAGGFARGLLLSPAPNFASEKDAELTLVCPHLGDGGVQRVVATLANAWAARGRRVTILTLYRHEQLYPVDPRVRIISVPDWREAGRLLRALETLRLSWERLRLKAGALWASWFPNPDGEETWFFRLPKTLLRGLGAFGRRLFERGLRNPRLRATWKLHLPTYLRVLGLRRAIRHAGGNDVIAFCGSTNVAAVLACEGEPNHLVISERNDPARQALRFPWHELRPLFYGDAQVVTANTRSALETMEVYVARNRLHYVPNPLDPLCRPVGENVAASRGPRLLTVGRLHPQKNHAVLLAALAALPEDLAEWRLSIVGQGELEEELREQARRLGVAERVDWHGQVEDPFPYYDAASVFVLPSIHEGSPNALIEAMSRGLAAIVSDASPGPLELVTDEVSGLVFPVTDAEALAAAIERLARAPDLRKRLGTEAQKQVSQHDLSSVLECWEDLLEPRDAV